MPRICILRHNYYPADVRLRREANVLLASGFEVDVVSLRLPGQTWREQVDGVRVYRLPLVHRRASRLRYVLQYLASLLLSAATVTALHLRWRYDVVQIATMPDCLIFAALVPKLLGAKLVLDMLDPMPELYMAKYGVSQNHPVTRLISLQEGVSMRLADLVITVLDEVKNLLAKRHRRQPVAVVMNCPDHTLFPRRTHGSIEATPDAGLRDRFVLLSHGAIVERLGYDTIVRAVALLKDAIPGLELRIAGSGEYAEELKELAFVLGVDDRVVILGYVPLNQIPALIADADIGIAANKNDCFANLPLPTKLLEYVWMGKPVVASKTSTISHYFDDSMLAFFEPNDEHDLAERILDLYGHPDRQRQLAVNAARFFDRYNWPTEGQRYRYLIANLTGWPIDQEHAQSDFVPARDRPPRHQARPDARRIIQHILGESRK